MSTKPNRKSFGGLQCTVCDKTFRTAKILNAHLVHTHQLNTSTSPRPESPPSDPLKLVASDVKITIQRKHCYKCNGNIHPNKQHFCEDISVRPVHEEIAIRPVREDITVRSVCKDITIRPVAAGLYTVERNKREPKQFYCGCARTYRDWRAFQTHIPICHREHMHGFFFPDHNYFWWWKEDLHKETGQRYFTQRPGDEEKMPNESCKDYVPKDGAEGGCQFWHCLHKPELDKRRCPSAILVTRFENGLLATFYSDHDGFTHKPYRVPPAFQRFSLGDTRGWLELPEDGAKRTERLAYKLRGLLHYTIDRTEKLDGKRLRLLYGKALDLVRSLNDEGISLIAKPTVTHQRTRPVNTVVGERVRPPPGGDQQCHVISSDEGEDDKDMVKIGKVFSLNKTGRRATTGAWTGETTIKRPTNGMPHLTLDGSQNTGTTIISPNPPLSNDHSEKAKVKPSTRSKDFSVQADPSKADLSTRTEKRVLTEVDIEEQLLSEVAKAKPNPSKDLVSDAPKIPAPSSLVKFTYADTFKDFVEKEFGKDEGKSVIKRRRGPPSFASQQEETVLVTEQSVAKGNTDIDNMQFDKNSARSTYKRRYLAIDNTPPKTPKEAVVTEHGTVAKENTNVETQLGKSPVQKALRRQVPTEHPSSKTLKGQVVDTEPAVARASPDSVETQLSKNSVQKVPKRRRQVTTEDASSKTLKDQAVDTEPSVATEGPDSIEIQLGRTSGQKTKRRRNLEEDTSSKTSRKALVTEQSAPEENPDVEPQFSRRSAQTSSKRLRNHPENRSLASPKENTAAKTKESELKSRKTKAKCEDKPQPKRKAKPAVQTSPEFPRKRSATVADLRKKYKVTRIQHSVTVSEVEQSSDTELKTEYDDEVSIEENGIGLIEDYKVMEREDDCNILILRI